MSTIIEVVNLSKVYAMGNIKVKALDDVSFTIEEGEISCIMGKSGSGKSTLLRQLGLLDKPTKGKIILNNRVVTDLSDAQRTELRLSYLGYVFQEYALLSELTAVENVYLPAMMLGRKNDKYRERAIELLHLVGLSERIDHLPNALSGGEQQRVAIARALINEPKIIFADEPCANLDSLSSKTVMETLVKLNQNLGVTIIFVSHDPDDKKYAKSLITLSDGKVIERHKI